MRALLVVLGIGVAGNVAYADNNSLTAEAPQPAYGIGVRVGGYGFRREGDARPGTGWNECRMNGVGIFADHTLKGSFYVEGGLDAYSSSTLLRLGDTSMDLPIDRMSGLVSAAVGMRTQLAPWLRGYIQIGAGLELTRVSVPYGDGSTTLRDDQALPEGFFGLGADIRISKGTYVGATFRTLVMGNFNYDAMRLGNTNDWVAPPAAHDVFAASPDLAAQGQFYLRRDL